MPRILEGMFAGIGLLALSPLFILIAILVKIHDGGTVFFRATRVGKDGSLFGVLKFRTMVPDAEKLGAAITASGDSRITPVGAFLRKHKLDELPQLINVVKGEMSLVGARPEDPRYVALYNDEQRSILAFRPGITSPASLRYRNEEALLAGPDWHESYIRDVLPQKLALDLAYLRRRSLAGDIRIILKTLGGILT